MSRLIHSPAPGRSARRAGTAFLALALTLLAACSSNTSDSNHSKKSGAIVVGQTSVADAIDPMTTSWDLTAVGVSESVYMVDDQGKLYSRIVDSTAKDGDLDWTLTLKDGVEFSDGTPVDAKAFAWAMNQIQEKNQLANASAGVMTFSPDGEAVKVHTERQTMLLESVLAEWTNVVYKDDGKGGFLFTGPYAVKTFQPSTQLDLVPNEHYPDADKRSDVTVKAFPDVDAMRLAIQSGSIDMAFTITPEVARQVKSTQGIEVKSIEAGYQYFSVLNLASPKLNDPAVRQSLDVGLNRRDYVDALLGGQIANGLFAHYYPFAGDIELAYDKAKAEQLLDQAGWVKGADGIRAKNGERLSLSLVTYTSRPDLSIIMQIMVSQLKELGIEATTSVVDDIRARLKQGDWDVAVYAQHTAPTGEPSFYLNQFFRTGAANNFAGYSSPAMDAELDKLGTLPAGAERDQQARTIQELVHTDLPVLFMVDPQWHIAVSDRLSSYQPYGGDYYVINPELGLK